MGTIKKTLPKIKKKLSEFLTDESGKITKKDALGISVGAALFAGVENVSAGPSAHVNGTGHQNSSIGVDPAKASWNLSSTATCNHASGVVNGHYSSVPSGTARISGSVTHGSHASHGSHGSHGSRR